VGSSFAAAPAAASEAHPRLTTARPNTRAAATCVGRTHSFAIAETPSKVGPPNCNRGDAAAATRTPCAKQPAPRANIARVRVRWSEETWCTWCRTQAPAVCCARAIDYRQTLFASGKVEKFWSESKVFSWHSHIVAFGTSLRAHTAARGSVTRIARYRGKTPSVARSRVARCFG
jgi:hypothetical protein